MIDNKHDNEDTTSNDIANATLNLPTNIIPTNTA